MHAHTSRKGRRRSQREGVCLQASRNVPTGDREYQTVVLYFRPLEPWENKCPLFKPARLWHFVVAAQADSHRLPGQRRVPREGGQRQTLASEPPGVSLGGHGHVSCCLAAGLLSPPLRARHALATPSASSCSRSAVSAGLVSPCCSGLFISSESLRTYCVPALPYSSLRSSRCKETAQISW